MGVIFPGTASYTFELPLLGLDIPTQFKLGMLAPRW